MHICQHSVFLSLINLTPVFPDVIPLITLGVFSFLILAACANLRQVLQGEKQKCPLSLRLRSPAWFVPRRLQVLRRALRSEQRQAAHVLHSHLHRCLQTLEPLHLSNHHRLLRRRQRWAWEKMHDSNACNFFLKVRTFPRLPPPNCIHVNLTGDSYHWELFTTKQSNNLY